MVQTDAEVAETELYFKLGRAGWVSAAHEPSASGTQRGEVMG